GDVGGGVRGRGVVCTVVSHHLNSESHLRQYRTLVPSTMRAPTRVGSSHCGQTGMTLELWMGISTCSMPPSRAPRLVMEILRWRVAMLTPSTMTLSALG